MPPNVTLLRHYNLISPYLRKLHFSRLLSLHTHWAQQTIGPCFWNQNVHYKPNLTLLNNNVVYTRFLNLEERKFEFYLRSAAAIGHVWTFLSVIGCIICSRGKCFLSVPVAIFYNTVSGGKHYIMAVSLTTDMIFRHCNPLFHKRVSGDRAMTVQSLYWTQYILRNAWCQGEWECQLQNECVHSELKTFTTCILLLVAASSFTAWQTGIFCYWRAAETMAHAQ
jgi:hypothetical protein